MMKELEALQIMHRAELIDGKICPLPSPDPQRQDLAGGLYAEIRCYLQAKKQPGHVYIAPVPVFPEGKNTGRHCLIPDVFVVCDETRVHRDGIYGAPDWAVELTGPKTSPENLSRKRALYERGGMREYWLISPEKQEVTVTLFRPGSEPAAETYSFREAVSPSLYPFLTVRMADLLY